MGCRLPRSKENLLRDIWLHSTWDIWRRRVWFSSWSMGSWSDRVWTDGWKTPFLSLQQKNFNRQRQKRIIYYILGVIQKDQLPYRPHPIRNIIHWIPASKEPSEPIVLQPNSMPSIFGSSKNRRLLNRSSIISIHHLDFFFLIYYFTKIWTMH